MKIVALTPFNIIPPNFGGAERCYNLLTRVGKLTTIALNWQGVSQEGSVGEMKYRLVPADPAAVEQSEKLMKLGVMTYDPMPMLTKNNLTTLKDAIAEEEPDLIILEHPWLYPFVADVPFIYDAHNAEGYLTQTRWPNSYDAQLVEELETQAVTKAKAITVCSEVDALLLKKRYQVETAMHYIPNGTDIPSKPAEGKTKNLIFIGSIYGPNVKAAQDLVNLAPVLDGYTIQILGPCAQLVKTDSENVELVGAVTEEHKDNYFQNAYAFVNLVRTGSGTSLKNARAMAYGLPVIATKVGARGYPTAIVTNTEGEVLHALRKLNDPKLTQLDWRKESEKNLAYAKTISWDVVGEAFRGVIVA